MHACISTFKNAGITTCIPARRFKSASISDRMNLVNGPMSAFFAVSAALMASGFAYARLYLKK
jgi:hypothetical protein